MARYGRDFDRGQRGMAGYDQDLGGGWSQGGGSRWSGRGGYGGEGQTLYGGGSDPYGSSYGDTYERGSYGGGRYQGGRGGYSGYGAGGGSYDTDYGAYGGGMGGSESYGGGSFGRGGYGMQGGYGGSSGYGSGSMGAGSMGASGSTGGYGGYGQGMSYGGGMGQGRSDDFSGSHGGGYSSGGFGSSGSMNSGGGYGSTGYGSTGYGGRMQGDELRRLRAADIMTENPEVVTADASLADAARKMKDLDVGIIPVVDSDSGRRLRGVITDRDIAIRAVAEGKDVNSTRVMECMTTELETCNKNDSVQDVLSVMEREQVRRVPITDRDGRLVGIVAQADVATDLDSNQGSRRVADTIERISEPGNPNRGGMMGRGGASTGVAGGGRMGGAQGRGGYSGGTSGTQTGGMSASRGTSGRTGTTGDAQHLGGVGSQPDTSGRTSQGRGTEGSGSDL